MTNPNLFNQLLIWPIINLLVAFYKGLSTIGIPGAFGWAIILLTVAIRFILYPLTKAQLSSAKKMADLKPHLDHLSKKHKDDKKRLQQEQLRLYKEAGVNPAAGCLPLLLQFPVLIALYRVFFTLLSTGNIGDLVKDINSIVYFPFLHIEHFDLTFFGVNLIIKPNQWQQYGWWLLLIPVITGVLQFIQAKFTPSMAPKPSPKKDEKSNQDDMQQAMQMQMQYFMPLLIGYFALSFPVGLSLYWNTFTIFAIIQQVLINKSHVQIVKS